MNKYIRELYKYIPDKLYLKLMYFRVFHKRLNLKNPQTFNEKLQWLKLYDRKPLYTKLVDKYEVREYIKETIGEEYLIPLLGVWNSFDEIDFESLPEQFVLKCTHDSGGIRICKDKKVFDYTEAKKFFEERMKKNYYYAGREWPYKDVEPRIIAEKLMGDYSCQELKDYKMMCFNGKVQCTFVCSDRFASSGLKVTFFDNDWRVLPFERHYPKSSINISKPKCFNKMINLSEKLTTDIPFARIDFYEIEGKVYFGEITFYPGCGFEEFNPDCWDRKLGALINLY